MKDKMKTWRDKLSETSNVKAVKNPVDKVMTAGYAAPKLRTFRLPEVTIPKPTLTAKSANMFYAAPEKHGTIAVKPKIFKNRTNTIEPSNDAKPASLAQFQKEIEAQKRAIADLDRKQYDNMLKSGNDHNKLEAIKTQHEAALKALKTRYSNAMGLGERKRGNQLLPQSGRKAEDYNNTLQQPQRDNVRTAEDDKAFWDGFKRGMGLKEGEGLGQESVMSGRPYSISSGPGTGRTPSHEARLNGEEEPHTQQSGGDGQFSSFQYGYSGDNPLLGDEPDPTVDDHVYITEEEYTDLRNELEEERERRSQEDGAQATYQDIDMQLTALDENRQWSICRGMVVETEPGSAQGLRVDIDSEEFDELKEMLGGSYAAAAYLADFVMDSYGDKFVDSRTRDSIIAEIYIHDYLNSLIPADFDYSSIKNSNMAEALAAWKLTAQELNLVYDGDANSLFAGIISIATGIAPFDFIDEGVLQQATYLFMLNDYRDRYGVGALTDFFQPY